MKKKLFAFMLSCACIASSSQASLKLSGGLSCFSVAEVVQIETASSKATTSAFELVCGDVERLLTLAHYKQIYQSDIMIASPSDHCEPTQLVSPPRPPALEPPTEAEGSRYLGCMPEVAKPETSRPAIQFSAEMIQAAQDSAVDIITRAVDFYVEPRRQVVETIAECVTRSAMNQKCSDYNLAKSAPQQAAKPIRSLAFLENYRPYDLSIEDKVWLSRMHHHLSAAKTIIDASESVAEYIAENEMVCPPPRKYKSVQAPQQVVIAPLQLKNSGPAYFIRKIPIDYQFITEPTDLAGQSESAIESSLPQINLFSSDQLHELFGQHVLPTIDFYQQRFDPRVLAKTMELSFARRTSRTTELVEQAISLASQIDLAAEWNWLSDAASKFSKQAARSAMNGSIKRIKSSLNIAQGMIERLELALSEQEAVNVADQDKQSHNR